MAVLLWCCLLMRRGTQATLAWRWRAKLCWVRWLQRERRIQSSAHVMAGMLKGWPACLAYAHACCGELSSLFLLQRAKTLRSGCSGMGVSKLSTLTDTRRGTVQQTIKRGFKQCGRTTFSESLPRDKSIPTSWARAGHASSLPRSVAQLLPCRLQV